MVFFFLICILCCNVDTTDNKYREKILNFIGKKSIGYSTLIQVFQKNPKLCWAWLRFETRNKYTHIDKNMTVWVSSFWWQENEIAFYLNWFTITLSKTLCFDASYMRQIYWRIFYSFVLFVCISLKKREQIYFCDGRKNNGSYAKREAGMKKTQDKENIEMNDNIDVQSL